MEVGVAQASSPQLPPRFFDVDLRDLSSSCINVKILASPSLTLSDFVESVYKQHIASKKGSHFSQPISCYDSEDEDDTAESVYQVGLQSFLNTISSILCGDTHLEAFLGHEYASLENLDSLATPIRRVGVTITYRTPSVATETTTSADKKKPAIDAFAIMMQNAKVRVSFLDIVLLDESPTLLDQILNQLTLFFVEKKLGTPMKFRRNFSTKTFTR